MATSLRLLLMAALAVVIAAPALAEAGCTKDTDCKGDRICVEERCVDPAVSSPAAPAPGAPSQGIDEVDIRYARSRRGVAHRNLHGTWVLFGFEAAAAVSFGGWLVPLSFKGVDDDSVGSFVSFFAVSVTAGVAGPIASIGGAEARRGLDRLGLAPVETGLRTPGLALYGVSMGFVGGGYGALAALIGSDRDCGALDFSEIAECEAQEETAETVLTGVYAGLGLTAATLGLISTALLQSDTVQQRRALLDAIDDAEAGRLGAHRPRVRIHGLAPWFDVTPDRSGGGLALTGTF